MLSSIHPLGERARHNRWAITAGAFVVGAVVTGTAGGALLGWLGVLLPGGGWRWLAAFVVAVAAGIADLVRIAPPGRRRQVNEDWIGTYRGWVYGVGFGAQLGSGFSTYVVTWGVWATALLAVLTATPAGGAIVGAAFGLGRSVFPLAAGWIDRPSRLTEFNRRMAAFATPVARGTAGALVVVGLSAALGMVLA